MYFKLVAFIGFVVAVLSGGGFLLTIGFCGITKMAGITDFGDLAWLMNHCHWLGVGLGLLASVSILAMMHATKKLAMMKRATQ